MIFIVAVSLISFLKMIYAVFFRLSLDCYRRKQRGDCDSLEFHKAAAERAQYIHFRNHPELQKTLPTTRAHSFREVTRHPSLSLRQIERQVLSNNHEV